MAYIWLPWRMLWMWCVVLGDWLTKSILFSLQLKLPLKWSTSICLHSIRRPTFLQIKIPVLHVQDVEWGSAFREILLFCVDLWDIVLDCVWPHYAFKGTGSKYILPLFKSDTTFFFHVVMVLCCNGPKLCHISWRSWA